LEVYVVFDLGENGDILREARERPGRGLRGLRLWPGQRGRKLVVEFLSSLGGRQDGGRFASLLGSALQGNEDRKLRVVL
jgi:hypothetical protein